VNSVEARSDGRGAAWVLSDAALAYGGTTRPRVDNRGRADHRLHRGVGAFPATRLYLSGQFPTALRGRGHLFGESVGRIFAGGLVPFFMAPHTVLPTIFFGTMLIFAAIGAVVPIVWGKETIGQIELVTKTAPELA
jgi:hypothetical protein